MKLKYILSVVLSSVVLFSGCVKEEANDSLKSIQVSKTYLAIAPAGSSAEVSINSTVAWNIKSTIPDWLSVSATSGNAGQSKLVFSAPACDYGREAVVQIAAGVHTQFLTIRQGEMTVETVTCKQVREGTEGKTYRVTGTCTAIANTSYGNWYMNDGTGEIYIYGTVDSGGSYNWSSFNIEVGDVVTVEGPMTNYNGTIEIVDAAFISVSKSLLKIDKESAIMPSAGGEIVVKAAYKGNGTFVNIPEDATSWVSLKSMDYKAGIATKLEKAPADTAIITFVVANNTSKSRNADIEISTKSGKNGSAMTFALSQLGLSGTQEIPFTVEEAIQFCKGLTGPTEDNYWVKGKVSKLVSGGFDAKYGNGTFWISADGEFNDDKSLDFEVYRAMYLGNQKYTADFNQIEVGDEVVICGQLTNYSGTCETNSGKAYVYSINTVTEPLMGAGTEENPFNVPAAISFCKKLSKATEDNFFVSGVISKLVGSGFDPAYGNGTFWISSDGKYNGDLSLDFEVYRALWLENKKWGEGDPQVAVGDKVVICGQLTNYKGTAETNSGKAWVYSYTPAD